MIESRRLNPLAVTSAKRLAALPAVPTIAESGVPGFNMTATFGLLAPAGTPDPLVNRLNKEVRSILEMQDVRDKFAAQGMEAEGTTPADFRARTRASMAELARLIKDANITLD
jgi:tripartite-type tricarboxylate transporter receptor subunit TctC